MWKYEIRNIFQIYGMRVLTKRKTQQHNLQRVLPLVASQAPFPIPPYIPFAPGKLKKKGKKHQEQFRLFFNLQQINLQFFNLQQINLHALFL
jgi:hypothetical protein